MARSRCRSGSAHRTNPAGAPWPCTPGRATTCRRRGPSTPRACWPRGPGRCRSTPGSGLPPTRNLWTSPACTTGSPSLASDREPWTEHASGLLASGARPLPLDAGQWPPADAQPVDITGLYDRLAELGFGYGPAFQGLRAAWRRGDELFAEVALADDVDGTGYGLHPALLDACLHAVLAGAGDEPGTVGVPFAWRGVSLHAPGVSAVRVRLAPAGENATSLAIADTAGLPVASVESLVTRPIPAGGLGSGPDRDSLFGIEWVAVPVPVAEPGPVLAVGS